MICKPMKGSYPLDIFLVMHRDRNKCAIENPDSQLE